MVAILIISAKLAIPALLKIKVFWSKGYDVITFVHDVNNKTLLPDSSYTLDAVMLPKFGNSRNYMR